MASATGAAAVSSDDQAVAAARIIAPAQWRIWLLMVVAASLVLMILSLTVERIWNADHWWQWKMGKLIASTGIPATDPFCYTDQGQPRVEIRWAYCLAVYWLTAWFGHNAVIITTAALIIVMFALAALAGPWRQAPFVAAAVIALAMIACSHRYLIRPEIITFVLFAAFVAIIERRRQRQTRLIWLLPLLEIIWVNTHGPFLLGPILAATWLGSELAGRFWTRWRHASDHRGSDASGARRIRDAAIILALLLLATLVNPYLHNAVVLPMLQWRWLHGTPHKTFIVELASTFKLERPHLAIFYYKALLLMAAASAIINLKNQRLFWVLLVGSQVYLSATAMRNTPLFCLVAIPYLIRNVHESWLWRMNGLRRATAPLTSPFTLALAAGTIAFSLHFAREAFTNRFAILQGETTQSGLGVAAHVFPVEATRFLKSTGAHGAIFNSFIAGAYLAAEGYQVFIGPHIQENVPGISAAYREISDSPARFNHYAAQYDFRIIMLETNMIPLIEHVLKLEEWRMVYADEVAMVFFHRDVAPHIPAIDAADAVWCQSAISRMGAPVPFAERGWLTRLTHPVPYRRFAALCFALKQYSCARTLFEWARDAYPPGFVDHEALAYSAEMAGDFIVAADAYEHALDSKPGDPVMRRRIVMALVRAGIADRARPHAEALLAHDPDDAEALVIRGLVELVAGRGAEAEPFLRRALESNPRDPAAHAHLGRALAAQQKYEPALASLEKSWRLQPGEFLVACDIAAVLLRLSRPAEALTWIQQAEAIRPNDPQVNMLRHAHSSMPPSNAVKP